MGFPCGEILSRPLRTGAKFGRFRHISGEPSKTDATLYLVIARLCLPLRRHGVAWLKELVTALNEAESCSLNLPVRQRTHRFSVAFSTLHGRGVYEILVLRVPTTSAVTCRPLDVYQGVLYVNSEYCAHAKLCNNQIIWSVDSGSKGSSALNNSGLAMPHSLLEKEILVQTSEMSTMCALSWPDSQDAEFPARFEVGQGATPAALRDPWRLLSTSTFPQLLERQRYTNLTFEKLGSELVLPFIFSSMRLSIIGGDGSRMTGMVRLFDPTMVNDDGRRHFIQGTVADELASPEAVREHVGTHTVGSQSKASVDDLTSPHMAPKRLAFQLVTGAANPLPSKLSDGAEELPTLLLDNAQLNLELQLLLYMATKYPMSDDDLKNFSDGIRPVEGSEKGKLPPELGSMLDGDLASWLKNTYVPGFIATRIIAMDPSSKTAWRVNFSDSEVANVNHWFSGKGKGCLSQAPEYTQLNELAARYALLQAFPRVQDYLNDTEPDENGRQGGEKWASALYHSQGRGYALAALANTTNVKARTKVQVVCNGKSFPDLMF
ncbi:uncharacterized protein MYCFIDRAFT_86971 [Pseudocercospora fijiensis CIRAD86]|uniref:Uncharacterized protein n=1 Tax=Pseudocercospora fijiensis (strain CIRAD86) TaxID=383855 RepID=M3A2V1_PSEFD|nr:uncharacterized protein MYCFIDRAFT_86971 [Pseudocercospora fijiensis CIRAD86]EME78731.1 hypothetical protein MYCFIDRAFT_86971 [Pseudocercospora fijiensis CIRAD86]